MRILVPVFTIVAIVALGAYINYTFKQARYLYSGPVVINVVGKGEQVAVPDIAMFSFTVHAEAPDASSAQSQSADAVNKIHSYLNDQGVEDKDIKTTYYGLNPHYEYPQQICATGVAYCPPRAPVLKGYDVDQTIQVKVRETDKAGTLISGAGERGATNVSGIQFTIDDEESVKTAAREKAIANAKEQAQKLADDLGVHIVRMTGYWEDQGPYPYGAGYGGADMKMESTVANTVPDIPAGENTVTVQVNVSYEVR